MTPLLLARLVVTACLHAALVFVITAGAVEVLLRLGRPQSPRLRYGLRLLPFAKVCYDLLVWDLHQWTGWESTALLQLPPKSKSMMVGLGFRHFYPIVSFGFSAPGDRSFQLGDVLAEWIGPNLTLALAASLILVSLVSLGLALLRVVRWMRRNQSESSAAVCFWTVSNPKLRARLKQRGVRIEVSSLTQVGPATAGFAHPRIVLPQPLVAVLSAEQIDAVVAHELEHLRWFDDWVLLAIKGIRSLFWFLPLGTSWLRNLIAEREIACDAGCRQYQLRAEEMREAILTALRLQTGLPPRPLTTGLTVSEAAVRRLLALSSPPSGRARPFRWVFLFAVCAMGVLRSTVGL